MARGIGGKKKKKKVEKKSPMHPKTEKKNTGEAK
jgi:hypothetical protein